MPALVQSASHAIASQSGMTCTITLGSPTTAGNCLVLAFSYFDPNFGGTVSSVTLGGGADNWARVLTSTGGSSQDWPGLIDFYADPHCAGGQTSIVITVSNLTPYPYEGINAWAGEFSGLSGAVDVSHTGYNYGGSGLNWTSGTTTATSAAAEAWVGMGVTWQNGGSNPITGPSSGGWTNTYISLSSQYAAVTGYQITSSAGTAVYAGTMATTGQSSNAAVICLLPVASPSPGAVTGKAILAGPSVSTGATTVTPAVVTGKASVGSPVISVPAQPAEHILVPAYSYPSSGSSSPYWEAMYSSPPALEYLVADVNSGTLGASADTDYQSAINQALATPGITVVGYVDTEHTSTPIATLETNIDLYFTYYGITSIFFDNASTDTGSLPYYTTLCNYVHTAHAGAITVLNHGVTPNQGYAAIADVMIVFEGPSYNDGTGIGDWQGALAGTDPGVPQLPASWFSSYPPGRFCAIVYETTPSTGLAGGTPEAWQAVLGQAQAAGIGVVYLTDATYAGNPYDVLPTYWSSEVAAVNATAAGAIIASAVTGTAAFAAPAISAALTTVAVHGTVSAAAPGVSGAASVTAAVVTGKMAGTAPAVTGAAVAAPVTAYGLAVIPGAALSLPAQAAPAVVTGTTVIAGTPAGTVTVLPAAVHGTTTVPAPVIATTGAVSPAVVPGTVSLAAPSLILSAVITPAAVPATTAVTGPALAAGTTVTPATGVPAATVLPGPAVAAGAVAAPGYVPGTAIVPAGPPTVTAGSATAAPATVPGTTTITGTPVAAVTAAPTGVLASPTVISGTASASTATAPAVVTGTTTIGMPGLSAVAAVTPLAVTGKTVVILPAPSGGAAALPAAWFAPSFLAGPGVSAALTTTLVLGAPAAISVPGVTAGLGVALVTGTTVFPAAAVSTGTTVTVISAITVPGATLITLPLVSESAVVLDYPPLVTVTATVPLTATVTATVPLTVTVSS